MRQLMDREKPSDQTPAQGEVLGPASGGGSRFLRRNNRGCKAEDFYNWPEQPFEDMDSPLAVQQYIQQLINRNPADIDEILRLPEGQDLGAWKIEHLRLFCMQLNRLAAKLQNCCFPETCNQMTATEQWIFLCAAHKQPNECPAIDYTRHTLDGAASLLNSNKYFPSRVTIKESSVAKLGSVCRRIYRIFSHAYYHHFQVFDEFERETHLCKRFSKFVTMYELMPKESLIVPADGSKPEVDAEKASGASGDTTVIDSTTDAAAQQAPSSSEESPAFKNTTQVQKSTPAERDPEPKVKVEPAKTETSSPAKSQVSAAVAAELAPATVVAPKNEPTSPKEDAAALSSAVSSKKSVVNSTTASPPKSTTWTPSPMSTNTMVKSSSNARSTVSSTDARKASTDSENKSSTKSPPAASGQQ